MPRGALDNMREVFLGGLVLFLFVGYAQAQIDRASLTGTLIDASGAVIPDVKIEAVALDTQLHFETLTNKQGVYRLTALPVGNYVVTTTRQGFESIEIKDIKLQVGETRTLNLQLKVGALLEKIEVPATTTPLQQTSSELGGVIEREQIANLPANGRNWASMLLLAPGAIDDGGGDQRTIRFAGRARDDNNFTMDGVDSTGIQEQAQKSQTRLQVSQESIQEYRVSSSLYTAEHGAGAGGQIDVISKTGTNEFHGGLFEYLRNSALDDRAFVDPPKIPPFRLNQFGGSLGGPMVKSRTFFFVSYEGLRQFQATTLTAPVPSAGLRAAILATSPQMAPILQAYPNGNSSFSVCNNPTVDPCTDNFVHAGNTTINEDSFLVRIDHRFTDRTSMFGRFSRDVSYTDAPLGNLFDRQRLFIHPENLALSLTHVFSSSVVNQFTFGVNRVPYRNPQVGAFRQNFEVDTDNFDVLYNDAEDIEVGTTFAEIDNLTITHGRHTFKMGGEFRRIQLNQGITTNNILAFTDDSSLINDSLNSALLRPPWATRGFRRFFVLPYFQDEWRVGPGLTLNLGLRWEYYSVPHEVLNRVRIFDAQRCIVNHQPGDQPGICPANSPLYFPNYRNFDPRVGIAWSPGFLHDKTVIRSGFGIYHGAGQNDDVNGALESSSIPTSLSSANIPTLSYPIDPFIPLASLGGNPRALQRDKRDLYVEQWGLTVAQELPRSFVFEASYIGSHGVRLFARNYINVCTVPPYAPVSPCSRPLPQFDQIDIKRNNGTSTFHGLNLSLQRTFTKGWLWQTQYILSHSINDGSVGGGEANAPENVACIRCDRGPSVFDVRHNVVTSSVYELPIGPGRRFWTTSGGVGKLLEGWSVSGIGIFHTGHPITVLFGPSASNIPDGNDQSDQRPDVVQGVSIIPPGGATQSVWINPAAFQSPPTDSMGNLLRFGDAGRGLVRAPHVWQIDFTLAKQTRITEWLSLEFRADAFNIFNHKQLGDPAKITLDFINADANGNPTFGSLSTPGDFGMINTTVNFNNNNDNFGPGNTGTGLPRQIQFSLRLKF
jgi:Carboxypeptidase regulatory-like domain/TonB dependent receptor